MTMKEFIERTGFEPTAEEYGKIEEEYYKFDGDKDDFCKAFAAGGREKQICSNRAQEIELLRSQILEMEKRVKRDIEDRDRRIALLKAELDRELEWKPADNAGTNMDKKDYEHLANSGRKMTEQEAKEFIAEECGFSVDKVIIRNEASAYEVNKHRRLREAAEFVREPVYASDDWNYVRFDCAGFMYEFVNGELRFYYC